MTASLAPPPTVSRRRLRWLAPATAAFALLGGFGFGPGLVGTSAGAPPLLPAVTAEGLLTKVASATPPAFSGTIQTRTNLGLPDLGSIAPSGSSLLTTLLSPQTLNVSAAPGGKLHLSIPDGMEQTEVVTDGTQLWLWQSRTQTVTHRARPHALDGRDANMGDGTTATTARSTPDGIAREVLAKADPSTRVFVRGTSSVAGRDAYELVLAPRPSATLVADVVIDIDAATSLALRVQVLAKDSASPAMDVGFTSIKFAAPPESTFAFKVPPGAKVVEATSPGQVVFGSEGNGATAPPRAKVRVLGTGWESVVVIADGPAVLGQLGRRVKGPWGSGTLVTSTLVDALVLDDGTVLTGMVGPTRLEAAAAEWRRP